MSDIVIKAENLGKKYTIGHQAGNGRYVALRDVLMQNARNLWHKTQDLARGKPIIIGDETEEVWALRGVSFEVRRGEVVGIIGRNGAGKSTLLKVLSRITEPSAGRVTIKGRVASLLEVGTGFHPELTGRENIYLNGAILGMARAEIKRKFDEIVAFAEIEKFLDTPVKRYSSGMYVRLAFAVAAHLEPEILLVDEVLAVGDAAFQKKSLGKMGDVAKEGRTVLFVSHNMGAVRRLCRKAVLLKNGLLQEYGNVGSVINSYLNEYTNASENVVFEEDDSDDPVLIKSASILNEKGESSRFFHIGDEIRFRVTLAKREGVNPDFLAIDIKTSEGTQISSIHSQHYGYTFDSSKEETVEITIGEIRYYPDKYYITLVVRIFGHKYIKKHDCLAFEVTQNSEFTGERLITAHGRYFVKADWSRVRSNRANVVSNGPA